MRRTLMLIALLVVPVALVMLSGCGEKQSGKANAAGTQKKQSQTQKGKQETNGQGMAKNDDGHDHPLALVDASEPVPDTKQKTCPVMGGPIDPKYHTEYKGRTIYFCCPGCEAKFKADPETYIAKVDAEIKAADEAAKKAKD